MSWTKEQHSRFLGRLSSLTLQIVLSVVKEEGPFGPGPGSTAESAWWWGWGGGVTYPGLSLWSALFLKAPSWDCAEKRIMWAQSCKLDESELSERFIGFIFFQIYLFEFSCAQELSVPLKKLSVCEVLGSQRKQGHWFAVGGLQNFWIYVFSYHTPEGSHTCLCCHEFMCGPGQVTHPSFPCVYSGRNLCPFRDFEVQVSRWGEDVRMLVVWLVLSNPGVYSRRGADPGHPRVGFKTQLLRWA